MKVCPLSTLRINVTTICYTFYCCHPLYCCLQPPSPALVLLALFFLVSLLLLFSQHSSQDDSFEMEVQLSYSYVQNPSVAFYVIYSKSQNIAVLTRPSII